MYQRSTGVPRSYPQDELTGWVRAKDPSRTGRRRRRSAQVEGPGPHGLSGRSALIGRASFAGEARTARRTAPRAGAQAGVSPWTFV